MAITGSYWAYGSNPKTGLVNKWFWRCESDDDEMGIVPTEQQAAEQLAEHLATHPENEPVEQPPADEPPVEAPPAEEIPAEETPVEEEA